MRLIITMLGLVGLVALTTAMDCGGGYDDSTCPVPEWCAEECRALGTGQTAFWCSQDCDRYEACTCDPCQEMLP